MRWMAAMIACVILLTICSGCQSPSERTYWMEQGQYWRGQAMNAKAELDEVKRQKDELLAKLESGQLDPGAFKTMYDELRAQGERVSNQYDEARAHWEESQAKFEESDSWGERAEMIFWTVLGMLGAGGGAVAHTRLSRGPSSKSYKHKLHDLADRLDEKVNVS